MNVFKQYTKEQLMMFGAVMMDGRLLDLVRQVSEGKLESQEAAKRYFAMTEGEVK